MRLNALFILEENERAALFAFPQFPSTTPLPPAPSDFFRPGQRVCLFVAVTECSILMQY